MSWTLGKGGCTLERRVMVDTARAGKVLIVENDAWLCASYAVELRAAGFTVLGVGTVAAARAHLRPECWSAQSFDFLVLDLKLPDGDGLPLVERAVALDPTPTVAVVSAFLDGAHAPVLTRLGAHFVAKPFEPRRVLELIEVLAVRRLDFPARYAREHRLSRRELETVCHELAGRSLEEAATQSDCKAETLRTYWSRIFRKTGMHTRREVAVNIIRGWSQALRQGFLAEHRQDGMYAGSPPKE